MSNPQDAESKQRSTATAAATSNDGTLRDQENLNKKIIIGIFILSLVIPFLYSWFDTTSQDIDATRATSGLPATWEELELETMQNFQEGIAPTKLSKLVLESLRGFEMVMLEDDSFYSVGYFLERTGNQHVTSTKWSVPLKKTMHKHLGTSTERTISYMHPVSNPMAPPLARATKFQRLERYNRHSILIQTFTDVQDVPMADCFVVEERLLIQSKGIELHISGYFRIDFTQPTMFRAIIERQTSQELKEYFDNYKSFLMAISTRRQDFWRPSSEVSDVFDSRYDTAPPTKKQGLGKAIKSAVTRPFRPVLRQMGKVARVFDNLRQKLDETKRGKRNHVVDRE
jgi:hypothetical protein